MPQNDRELIRKAFFTNDWGVVAGLKEKAKTTEAKEILHDRMIHLYRKEEWFAEQL